MKFWKYGRVALALMGSVVLGLSITCCGVYTSGYMYVTGAGLPSNNGGLNGQIGAFKIDHDFGYLTPVTGQPFASVGSDPVQEVVIPGGRFLAVANKGSNSVSIYTIGGAGVLYFQHQYSTSGTSPVSIGMNTSGNYLYTLDQFAPDGSGRGDITVFSIDPSTGKLTLITNQNTFNTNGTQLNYFEVNYNPVQIVTASGGGGTGTGGAFAYVLDTAYPSQATSGVPAACVNQPTGSPCTRPDVFLYAINSSTGQLTLTQNAPLTLSTLPGAASTIAVGSHGYVYIADTALAQNGSSGLILPYTIGSGGVLQTLVGGPVPNVPGASTNPDAILASSNGQFLYVANFGTGNINQPNSNISGFTVDTANGILSPVATATNPFPSGSGPIWMALDATNQYLYTANFNDNTITGKVIDQTHGLLSPLLKGNVQQPTVGKPTFLVVNRTNVLTCCHSEVLRPRSG